MKEMSIFVDESGDAGETSRFYLITLVFHEQDDQIADIIQPYEQDLFNRGFADIPMHLSPLINGNDDYRHLPIAKRKSYLSCFRILADHLPFRYATLAYEKCQFNDSPDKLLIRMRRDLTNFLFDNIEYLQQFDVVKVYYDNGQAIVTNAIHDAIEYVLARDAIVYKDANPRCYRLSQLADYICSIELIAIKFQNGTAGATDRTFFGEWGSFKRNYLKKVRKKRLG